MLDEYELINEVSRFLPTFQAKKKGTQDYYTIIKIKKKDDEIPSSTQLFNEAISIIKEINHPNIVKLVEYKEDSNYHYCIMEYCNGGDIGSYLTKRKENNKPISEEEVQYIMKQVVDAIKYLHEKKIVHRDIKPDNLLIKYDTEEDLKENNILKAKIKLSGFEISSHIKEGGFLDLVAGTLHYIAPEIDIQHKEYNEKVDIWSLGVTFTDLFFCDLKFEPRKPETYDKEFSFPNLSKESNSFINCTLQYNPEKRKSAEELLKHDFLTKNTKDFCVSKA